MLSASRTRLTAALIAATLAVGACSGETSDTAAPDAPSTEAVAPGPAGGDAADTAPTPTGVTAEQPTALAPAETCTSPLDGLDQRQRIAQLFTVGVSSMADAGRAVHEHGVGGIFLGGDVVGEVVAGDGLDRLHEESPLPLLVSIDEEGGRVSRVAPFAGPMPSARVMAATMEPARVRDLARERGEFLRGMGVTVDFAPSVDVSDQPDGAVIGDRSFSPDPARVIDYARAFAAGLSDAGITPVFKHFPGHGRSTGDSHHSAVAVPPLDHLVPHDLRPFAELADTPGAGMMVGHQQVPGLTGVDRPSSLSAPAYDLLRDGRGFGAGPFGGVIFTDDLSGMRAITDVTPLPRAVAESLIAGADSPLWITTQGLPEALDAAEQAVADGWLPRAQLEASLARVAALRGIHGCLRGGTTSAGLTPTPDLPPHPELPALPR